MNDALAHLGTKCVCVCVCVCVCECRIKITAMADIQAADRKVN